MIPAMVFHPSELIAEEAQARGWAIWDVAERMGGDPATNVLALQFYALRDPDGRLGGDGLERAFGVSADFWLRFEELWRAHPDARNPDNDHFAWFEVATDTGVPVEPEAEGADPEADGPLSAGHPLRATDTETER